MTSAHAPSDTAGVSSEAPAVLCSRCRQEPRDRLKSSYCRVCRNAHAAEYRARARPRPTYETKTCALDDCDVEFQWCSMRPKQTCCSKAHYMQKRWRDEHPITADPLPADLRWCSGCQASRQEGEFSPSQWQRSKRSARCRRCMAAYEASWRKTDVAKARASAATRRSRAARLLRAYGASCDDIDLLLDQQGGTCYLCNGPAGVRGFHIDHDHELHEAGRPSYRGLACHGCNVGSARWRTTPSACT